MADTGLIVTVVIFCFIFAWIIVFSILAIAFKKPIFEKLSIIGPLGHKIHLASKGLSLADQLVHGIEKRGKVTSYSSVYQSPDQSLTQIPESPDQSLTQIPESPREPITNGGRYGYAYSYDEDNIDPEF